MKNRLSVFVITCLFFLVSFYQVAHASCAKPQEFQAMHMRALQSELMVAALSCGLKKPYSTFVNSYSDVMKNGDAILKTYFIRSQKGKGEKALNEYVTGLANYSSKVSLAASRDDYCDAAANLFDYAMQAEPNQIAAYVKNRYADWHGVKQCN